MARKYSLITGGNLERVRPRRGDPPADGQLGKEGGEGGDEKLEKRIDIHYTCTYINYTEESKLELRGSLEPVGRSFHNYRVGDTCKWIQRTITAATLTFYFCFAFQQIIYI